MKVIKKTETLVLKDPRMKWKKFIKEHRPQSVKIRRICEIDDIPKLSSQGRLITRQKYFKKNEKEQRKAALSMLHCQQNRFANYWISRRRKGDEAENIFRE